nr:retrotransposon Gag domain-containing protein [Tanacetum cinerariifolium]
MTGLAKNRNKNEFCEFHGDKGHSTDKCIHLRKQIEEAVKSGQLSHLVKDIKQGGKRDFGGANERGVENVTPDQFPHTTKVGINHLHSLAYAFCTSSARPDRDHFLSGAVLRPEFAACGLRGQRHLILLQFPADLHWSTRPSLVNTVALIGLLRRVGLSLSCFSLENALAVREERVLFDAVTRLCLLLLGLFFLSHDSDSENWVCKFRWELSPRVSLSDAWVTGRGSPYYPVDNRVVAVRDVDVLPRCPMLCLLLFLVWSRVTVCRLAVRDRGMWSSRSLPLCVDYDPCGDAGLMLIVAVCQLYFLRSGRYLTVLDPFRCWA